MSDNENLTVVIVTYRTSEKVILDCLKSIDPNIKILIVENSKNFVHEKMVQSKFSNVKILCTGENLGYGKGNNFGIKSVETDYVLILNPDVICELDLFNNIIDVINNIHDFTIIGCQYAYDKTFMPAGYFDKRKNETFKKDFMDNKINSLHEVDWVTGCSMLINLKKFKDKEIFDKNFFLYFEEIDLCKSIINRGDKIYTSDKLKIHHLSFKSSIDKIENEKHNINKLREWHWMWSSFYFYKKNYGYFYAMIKMNGKLFKSLFKTLFYLITFQKELKDKYFYRFLGILNSMLFRPSSFRSIDNNN